MTNRNTHLLCDIFTKYAAQKQIFKALIFQQVAQMKNFLKSITFFFVVGIILILVSIFGLVLISTSGINGAMLGGYLLLLLFPALIIVVLDRICVWKFGAKKVNKISLYILAGLFGLAILNSITGNAIIRFINNSMGSNY